jgi:hypothetical protein
MALAIAGTNNATSGNPAVRGTYDGSLVSTDGHGKYQQAVLSGNCFISSNQTGVTTQAGLSATTPVLTLFNPKGNTKLLSVWYAGIITTVVNGAAAVYWLAANTNVAAAAVTGTAATFSNCQIGNAGSPTASIFTAATLPAAPIAIATLAAGLTGAITTIPYISAASRWFDGSLIVLPGAAISFQTSTASGASSTFAELIWEEIPATALNS